MARVVSSQAVQRSIVRPLGVEFNFVAVAFTALATGAPDFSFTPSLGERVWLEHIWIWGHPANAVDWYDQIFFEVRKVVAVPKSVAEVRGGENVLPIFHKTAPTIWGLGYGVWQMDFTIGRWFEGPGVRFAMRGEGVSTASVNMHAAFRYMKPEG